MILLVPVWWLFHLCCSPVGRRRPSACARRPALSSINARRRHATGVMDWIVLVAAFGRFLRHFRTRSAASRRLCDDVRGRFRCRIRHGLAFNVGAVGSSLFLLPSPARSASSSFLSFAIRYSSRAFAFEQQKEIKVPIIFNFTGIRLGRRPTSIFCGFAESFRR